MLGTKNGQHFACLLLALLLGGFSPDWVDALEADAPVVQADTREETVDPAESLDTSEKNVEPDVADDEPDAPCPDTQLALMSMILMIGNVPTVSLTTTGLSTSDTTGHHGSTGGGGSTSPDPTPPSETPEPASWLLALVGSVCAGSGAWLRHWRKRTG